MKKFFILLASVLALIATSATLTAKPIKKIGVMNLQGIVQNSSQMSKIKADLKSQFQDRENKIVALQNKLQSDISRLKKEGAVMQTSERKALENEITQKQQHLQTMQLSFQKDYLTARDKALTNLFKEIKGVVDKIAEKEQYDLIITNEPVAYALPSMDVTKEVSDALAKDK